MTDPMRARNGAHTVRIAVSATPRREERGQALARELPALIGSGTIAEWHAMQDARTCCSAGTTALVVLLDAMVLPPRAVFPLRCGQRAFFLMRVLTPRPCAERGA